jgi:hypothetical protein
MNTRRDFVQGVTLALVGMPAATDTARADPSLADEATGPGTGQSPVEQTGSDVGSLFPFIARQVLRGEFPLSFLRNEFRDATTWKRRARGKLKELLHVIDTFHWGERRMLLDGDPADWRERPATIQPARVAEFNRRAGESEPLVARTIYAAGFTWSGVMFTDDVRTVDYLATRPEVDPDRIGCVGLSVGGLRSCHLAALDHRIKAAVVVGWMAS